MRRIRSLALLLALALLVAGALPAHAGLLDYWVYLPVAGHPVALDRVNFVAQLVPGAQEVSRRTGIPAAVLIAQAIRESGYGWTRLALAAANVFSVKTWGPPEVPEPDPWWPGYELVGQPEEDRNNHYRIYSSVAEAIAYQGEFLLKDRYRPALENYRNNVANGMPIPEACYRYARDLRLAGYAEDEEYEEALRRIMNNYIRPSDTVHPVFNLYQYNIENGGRFFIGQVPSGVPNPTIRQGDTDAEKGGAVAQLQRLLGLYADGVFGPATARALQHFQRDQGLAADGIAGAQTWVALTRAPAPYFPPLREGDTDRTRRGMVSVAQRLLGVPADGVFGPATRQAVERLQQRLGIETERGFIGRITWSALWGGGLPVDRVPPVVELHYPLAPRIGATTLVMAGAADDVGVDRVEYWLDGRHLATAYVPPYRATLDTAGLADGSAHTLEVRAIDAAGNVGRAQVTVTAVTRDQVGPRVQVQVPGGATRVAGQVPLLIDATDGSGVRQVDCYAGNRWLGPARFDRKRTPAWSCTWDASAVPAGTQVTLRAVATDFNGNTGSGELTVTVDPDASQPPAVWLETPGPGATVQGVVPIRVGATAPLFIRKVEIYIDGWRARELDRPPYTFQWRTASLKNGTYRIWARAYDATGKVAETPKVAVTVANPDRVAPTVALTAPLPGQTVADTVRLEARAADYQGVERVEFWVDGTRVATRTTPPYVADLDTRQLADGTHTVVAKAYDAWGNEGQSAPLTLRVQNARPAALRLTGPAPGQEVRHTVRLQVAAPPGTQRVEYYVDGRLAGTATDAPFALEWDSWDVANGLHRLEARAVLAGGGEAWSGRIPFVVANPLPDALRVLLVLPEPDGTVRGKVPVAAPAYSGHGVAWVDLYVNDWRLRRLYRPPYVALWDTAWAPAGQHTLRAVAYDVHGNVVSSNRVTVTVAREQGRG